MAGLASLRLTIQASTRRERTDRSKATAPALCCTPFTKQHKVRGEKPDSASCAAAESLLTGTLYAPQASKLRATPSRCWAVGRSGVSVFAMSSSDATTGGEWDLHLGVIGEKMSVRRTAPTISSGVARGCSAVNRTLFTLSREYCQRARP